MARAVEEQIDHLYKLPLSEFTAARQALAKTLSGEAAARVKSLAKPHVAAWAANQVYWQARPVYDRLVKAATQLRSAHKAALAGRTANIRDADDAHREAVRDAVREAVTILEREGRPVSAATHEAISRTMAALPIEDTPGRLDRPLAPSGFEALAGIVPSGTSIAPALRLVHSQGPQGGAKKQERATRTRSRETPAVSRRELEAAQREITRAETRLRDVQRDAREGETRSRRTAQTLERARSTQERLERELAEAEESVRHASNELRRLAKEVEEHEHEARRAERELAAARERLREIGGHDG